MSQQKVVGILLLGMTSLTLSANAALHAIYGKDDRQEVSDVESTQVQEWAKSSVGLFESATLDFDKAKDIYRTNKLVTLHGRGACKDERFSEQLTSAFCSGSLIGPDLVLTAGHCVRAYPCDKVKYVFDYKTTAGSPNGVTEFTSSQVYGCKKIEIKVTNYFDVGNGAVFGPGGMDFAVVRLDRKVEDRKTLELETKEDLKTNDPIVMIGHPIGLPAKVTPGKFGEYLPKINYFRGNTVFSANLDTFGGNSGSAVFNPKTNKIEGVLVRSMEDFETFTDPKTGYSCKRSKKYEDMNGSEVIRADVIAPRIQKLLDRR